NKATIEYYIGVALGLVMSFVEFVIKVVMAVIEFLVMIVLTFLMDFLWLIIRAILLAIIFALIAIELLVLSIEFLVTGLALSAMSQYIGFAINYDIDWTIKYGKTFCVGFLEFELLGKDLRIDGWMEWIYWKYFDLYLPLIVENIIFAGIIIQSDRYEVISFDSKNGDKEPDTEFNELPTQASETAIPPSLFNRSFSNITPDQTKFNFEVRFFDSNFEEPDTDYGVRLHLIAPNGTTLAHFTMDTEDQNPDYSNINGVLFNYTVDFSSYKHGLWHYYFTVKDSSTGDIVFYPENDYLVGPYTSKGPIYLTSTRVASSSTAYYNPEGWEDDNFYFYVDWWDMIYGTVPINITLCLIPAKIAEEVGISETTGIQKFDMQPVDANPNYTNPVEYRCIVNFEELGYDESEIGIFHHYFEATTNDGKIITRLDYDGNESCNIYGPIVKSSNHPDLKIEFKSSETLSTLLWSESSGQYVLTYTDKYGDGPSETPEITFTRDSEIILQEDMKLFYISSDGTTRKYFFEFGGEKLSTGRYDVSIEVKDQQGNTSDPLENSEFNTLYILGSIVDVLYSFNSMAIILTSLQGAFIVPISLASDESKSKLLTIALLGVSIATLFGFLIYSIMKDDDFSLLGFSLSCLFSFMALILLDGFKDTDNPINNKLLGKFKNIVNFLEAKSKYIMIFTALILLSSVVFSLIFQPFAGLFQEGETILATVTLIAGIISLIPSILGFLGSVMLMSTAYMADFSSNGLTLKKGSDSLTGKTISALGFIQRSIGIYRKVLLVTTLIGLIVWTAKLELELGWVNTF
ncbi:MAG: hypothetical protein ACFFAN_08915, partial [Promethearchaeota archaeon]